MFIPESRVYRDKSPKLNMIRSNDLFSFQGPKVWRWCQCHFHLQPTLFFRRQQHRCTWDSLPLIQILMIQLMLFCIIHNLRPNSSIISICLCKVSNGQPIMTHTVWIQLSSWWWRIRKIPDILVLTSMLCWLCMVSFPLFGIVFRLRRKPCRQIQPLKLMIVLVFVL